MTDSNDMAALLHEAQIAGLGRPCTNLVNRLREALARVTAERDAAVVWRVKPLEWEALGDRFWRAQSPLFGSFRVECYGDTWQALWSVPGYCDTFVHGNFASADDAMAAIDAHYLAALHAPEPAPAGEPVAWRWRPKDSVVWIYDPTLEWLDQHRHEVEAEPLYAHPAQEDRK